MSPLQLFNRLTAPVRKLPANSEFVLESDLQPWLFEGWHSTVVVLGMAEQRRHKIRGLIEGAGREVLSLGGPAAGPQGDLFGTPDSDIVLSQLTQQLAAEQISPTDVHDLRLALVRVEATDLRPRHLGPLSLMSRDYIALAGCFRALAAFVQSPALKRPPVPRPLQRWARTQGVQLLRAADTPSMKKARQLVQNVSSALSERTLTLQEGRLGLAPPRRG